MAKNKRKIPLGIKPISQMIEEGQNLKGQKGFVRVDFGYKEVYIPVVVQGMKVAQEGACGISLLVRAQGGFEDFETSPCDFFSTKEEIQFIKEAQDIIEQAQKDFQEIGKWGTAKARQRAAEDYVKQHELDEVYLDEMGKDVSDSRRNVVMQTIVSIVYKLTPEQIDSVHFSGWRSGRY